MTNFVDVNWQLKVFWKRFDVLLFHWLKYGSSSYIVLILYCLSYGFVVPYLQSLSLGFFQSMTHLVYRITQDLVEYI